MRRMPCFVLATLLAGCASPQKTAPLQMAAYTYHIDDPSPEYISEDNLFRVQVLRTGFEFARCHSGPGIPFARDCETWDLDGDGDVDQVDFGFLQEMMR